ncbi:uncharacterized protein BT62DRAFT_1008985 [Guyanagaster necrorhizus]|uniref:Uncharacterized protein n=1 Tax=Guyanagaster necrorhizus TaxID=856835 RepID=A0A9P7VLY3_9AGAR|nr:uncharacterized protein BT62DRAFT_1008985 [Guyanagaster necrorhizus MCA 3950]KAG7443623.1 hypothetical protein BT62DRAFT_1008985 [Guyanagaster necrorhizus MCA 3950]
MITPSEKTEAATNERSSENLTQAKLESGVKRACCSMRFSITDPSLQFFILSTCQPAAIKEKIASLSATVLAISGLHLVTIQAVQDSSIANFEERLLLLFNLACRVQIVLFCNSVSEGIKRNPVVTVKRLSYSLKPLGFVGIPRLSMNASWIQTSRWRLADEHFEIFVYTVYRQVVSLELLVAVTYSSVGRLVARS